jgi:uncharacterized membrane protein
MNILQFTAVIGGASLVAFSAFAFLRQRDWLYVVVTSIVLTVLLYSLAAGR